MTMHLAQGLSTINTRKPKKKTKYTKVQIEKWTNEMKAYNKRMRQIHAHDLQMTLEEYIEYIHGRFKSKKKIETSSKPWNYTPPYVRETPHIPSADNMPHGVATKPEPKVYTGDLIVGIATMHKSNAVPVMRGTKQAEDIAKMRR